MSDSARYFKAMIAGMTGICSAIEQKHGLYGYPPELVSVGLAAADRGECPEAAVAAYIEGDTPDHLPSDMGTPQPIGEES